MASFLDNAAAAIAKVAAWKAPAADERGVYAFSLQGDLDMELFSPDAGNTLIFRATVQPLPEEERTRDELLLAQAQRAVVACRERKSTLALEDSTLILQRVIRARDTGLDALPEIAKSFLNDLAWWRAQAARLTR